MQDDLNHNLAASVLMAVPSHREDAKSVLEIAQRVSNDTGVALEITLEVVKAVIVILDSFGVLNTSAEKFRMQDQTPNYFRLSLLWYLQHKQKIFSNWNRHGTARDIRVSSLLDQAAHFLKAMEHRRESLSRVHNIELTPTRVQPVSIILVKAKMGEHAYFLHQWDQAAERYQPIGGKGRDNESHLETAKREFREEMSDHDIVYGKDYELDRVFDSITEQEISRTYGSLTHYTISVYQAAFSTNKLNIGVSDRWLTIEEINNHKTRDGRDVSPFCSKLNALKPGFIERLPYSITLIESQTRSSKIFVSYRRDDSAGTAGWIHEKLSRQYRESVFKDAYSIDVAENIRSAIGRALRRCDVVVAVIGSKWLGSKNDGTKRIHDEHDWIRCEIEIALQLGIPVIPVLVERAQMPQAHELPERMREIAMLNALQVDPSGDFQNHIDRLVEAIDRLTTSTEVQRPPKGGPSPR